MVAEWGMLQEGEQMKVLVVEAEEATLKATGIMLNKLGYKLDWGPVATRPSVSTAMRDPTMLFSLL